MTTISSPESTSVDDLPWDQRIGKSNFWLQATQEELGPSASWRLSIVKKPARASKTNPPLVLVQFTPLKPLFTFELEGHSYPLMMERVRKSRGGKIVMEGTRKVGAKQSSVLKWSGEIKIFEEDGTARIEIEGRFRCSGTGKNAASVQVRIPLVVYQPVLFDTPLPEGVHVSAAAAWAERAQSAISLCFPDCDGQIASTHGSFLKEINDIDLRGRSKIRLALSFKQALLNTDAVHLVRSEVAQSQAPAGKSTAEPLTPFMSAARAGIRRIQDVKNCTTIGKERWYFRANESHSYNPGYPLFTAEASPALVRWSKLYQSEIAERTANLTARGVAADFSVISGAPGAEGNKGAFWDFASGPSESLTFSGIHGRQEFGIASSSRIAFSIFMMLSASRDPLFRQAGLNTCHWLLLKQNSEGYYDGPFVSAKTGKSTHKKLNLDGVLAIRPLVAAFESTHSEIFVTAALRIAKHFDTHLAPEGEAPCLYGIGDSKNCPVALSAVVQSLLDLNALSSNETLRNTVAVAAEWLALCQFDELSHQCFDYDGNYSGALECAQAALRLFALSGKERWFRLGHMLVDRVVKRQTNHWRLADASISLLLCLAGLIPDTVVDLPKMTVTTNWRTFSPDTAAALYYDIRDGDENMVDFMPLVCRESNQTLLLILAPAEARNVRLIKRNQITSHRVPIFDMVTGEQCSLEIPMHELPSSVGQFSVIRVDP